MKISRSALTKGITLIELMIVVAIIALLAGLAVANIRSNKPHDALVEFNQQIQNAFIGQRSRALTTSRATYIIFNGSTHSIELKIGNDSRCSAQSGAHANIFYTIPPLADQENNVGIDLATDASQRRTLTSMSSNTFYNGDTPFVTYAIHPIRYTITGTTITETVSAALDETSSTVICFQPNGRTNFYALDGSELAANAIQVELKIAGSNPENFVGGFSEMVVEQYGNIRSRYIAY